MEIRTILTPTEIAALPGSDLRSAACVVFDVLRATSTILAALANGARGIIPVLTAEEAFAMRDRQYPDALLGGERGGLRIDGFDLGNSPREYLPGVVAERDILTTTTNGTVALRACAEAGRVFAGGLVNVAATASALRDDSTTAGPLLLVCAGTGQDFALEDGLAAGALATRLHETGAHEPDDATRGMMALYESRRHDLPAALSTSANGRRLMEIGLGEDVAWCARESVLEVVAVMQAGVMRKGGSTVPKDASR